MLQIYVLLYKPEQTGIGVLVSIAISALTTGFTSALISFDKDIDVSGRKNQPSFNGYIPDDHATRGRCFFLMTIMSALHNLSRSVGCALLAKSGKLTILYFVVGEMTFYLLLKIGRRDFMYWVRVDGLFSYVASFLIRVAVKVIVDFSGCIHMRHP